MWNYGDVIACRGTYENRPWHVLSGIVVKDSPEEIVLLFLPGAETMAEKSYTGRERTGKRRWDFKNNDWELAKFLWHTNRVLAITEPDKYYSIMLFWNQASDEFLGYYVNFQLPFQRNRCAIDTLDLDLDIDIEPDLSFRWKDEDDYRQAIEHSIIRREWVAGIEAAKPEVLDRLTQRRYPFDGSWLDWKPDPDWLPPKLPSDWDVL